MSDKSKIISLDDLRKRAAPYEFEVENLGFVRLKALTHGDKRELANKYFGDDGVNNWPDFRDDVVLRALVEPVMTRDDLGKLADDIKFVDQVYQHAARKAGLITATEPVAAAKEAEESVAPLVD